MKITFLPSEFTANFHLVSVSNLILKRILRCKKGKVNFIRLDFDGKVKGLGLTTTCTGLINQ